MLMAMVFVLFSAWSVMFSWCSLDNISKVYSSQFVFDAIILVLLLPVLLLLVLAVFIG